MVPEGLAEGLPTDLLPMEAGEAGVTGLMEVIPPVVTRGRTTTVILGHVAMVAESHLIREVRPEVAKGQAGPVAARVGLLRRHQPPHPQGAVAPEVMEPRATGRST